MSAPPAAASRRPENSAFNQQKLRGYQPSVTLNGLIAIFFVLGLLFVPLGVWLLTESDNVKEYSVKYDSSDGKMDVACSITEANANGNCSITYTFTEAVTGPLYVYYEISNFYQNHRRYVKSRSAYQLMGSDLGYDEVYDDCFPLVENDTMLLNPCGLIANSFFNGELFSRLPCDLRRTRCWTQLSNTHPHPSTPPPATPSRCDNVVVVV